MSAQKTIGTQFIQTIRGKIFAIDRKLNNQNSTWHIITPQIIREINYPRHLTILLFSSKHFIITQELLLTPQNFSQSEASANIPHICTDYTNTAVYVLTCRKPMFFLDT